MKIPSTIRLYGYPQHVVGTVNDIDSTYNGQPVEIVVLRTWSRRKQRWNYSAEPAWVIEYALKMKREDRRKARAKESLSVPTEGPEL